MLKWIMIAALPLAACGSLHQETAETNGVTPSGSGASRSYAVADFTGVELRGPDNVDVKVGGPFSVRAEGDPGQLDQLVVERVGDQLRVDRKHGLHWDWHDGKPVRVFVTLPSLKQASLAGSGDMTVDKASGDFDGSVSGSGNLRVGAISGGSTSLSIAGSGGLVAGGAADKLHLSIAGSGDIDATGLKANSGEVSIAGSGNVRATVAGPVDVSLMGSGDADIKGGARCSVSKLGSGEAHCV